MSPRVLPVDAAHSRARIADARIYGLVQDHPGLTLAGLAYLCGGLDGEEVAASLARLVDLLLVAADAGGLYDVVRAR